MKPQWQAFRVYQESQGVQGRLEQQTAQELDEGDVVIQVHYSSINFKDALGVTGKGKIYKKFPIIAGIDAAGVVEESSQASFPKGMQVLVTGCGLGETHDGGYAEYIRVPAAWVVPLPEGLSLFEAMALGTAGFTAALCIQRLQDNGQSPDKGPMVVTGATGGVGSLAINILAGLGYEVIAVSGKAAHHAYLKELGAREVLSPQDLSGDVRPLESVRWGGAIDNVGGKVLSNLLAHTQLWGNIACVGLALSPDLHATLMPLILRGVSLLGVSSTNCPYPLRAQLWQKLATQWKPNKLDVIVKRQVKLAELEQVLPSFLERKVVGRYVVDCQS